MLASDLIKSACIVHGNLRKCLDTLLMKIDRKIFVLSMNAAHIGYGSIFAVRFKIDFLEIIQHILFNTVKYNTTISQPPSVVKCPSHWLIGWWVLGSHFCTSFWELVERLLKV